MNNQTEDSSFYEEKLKEDGRTLMIRTEEYHGRITWNRTGECYMVRKDVHYLINGEQPPTIHTDLASAVLDIIGPITVWADQPITEMEKATKKVSEMELHELCTVRYALTTPGGQQDWGREYAPGVSMDTWSQMIEAEFFLRRRFLHFHVEETMDNIEKEHRENWRERQNGTNS